MVPGLEDFLLEHDLGDAILRRLVVEITHGQIGTVLSKVMDRKVSGLVAHRQGSVGSPFRVLRVSEPLLLSCSAGRFVEVFKNHVTDSVIDSREVCPLNGSFGSR